MGTISGASDAAGERASRSAASAWVSAHLPPAPRPGARLLDVACGNGRHTRLGLALGYRVTAIDRDLSGIEALARSADPRQLELIGADLEAGPGPVPIAAAAFDAVVVTNYLWRPLLPVIVDAVAPRGVLIYETFAIGQAAFGRPTNPEFLLRPGELIESLRKVGGDGWRLVPIAFEHGRVNDAAGPAQMRMIQRLFAVDPDHPAVLGETALHGAIRLP